MLTAALDSTEDHAAGPGGWQEREKEAEGKLSGARAVLMVTQKFGKTHPAVLLTMAEFYGVEVIPH